MLVQDKTAKSIKCCSQMKGKRHLQIICFYQPQLELEMSYFEFPLHLYSQSILIKVTSDPI